MHTLNSKYQLVCPLSILLHFIASHPISRIKIKSLHQNLINGAYNTTLKIINLRLLILMYTQNASMNKFINYSF